MPDSAPRTLVVIPTYCEKENIAQLVARVRAAVPAAHVLIVDDNSPDGTGQIADGLAAADPNIRVLHRTVKDGLGRAYVAGFSRALSEGFTRVVEMDADGSHQPEQIPLLLAAVEEGADVAIGTRWMPGGSVVNWPLRRQLISRVGTAYARIMLHSPLRDVTSGFRAFRASALTSVDLSAFRGMGYVFQIEMVWRAQQAGLTVVEVPITFIERVAGASKMSFAIAWEAMVQITRWGVAGVGRKSPQTWSAPNSAAH